MTQASAFHRKLHPRPIPFLAGLLLVATYAGGAEPAPVRYTGIISGKPVGSVVCRAISTRERECDFEYQDRGFKPKLHQRVEMDPAGVPVRLTVTGDDGVGGRVDESFTREGDRATWKNLAEKGSSEKAGRSFYLPFYQLPSDAGMLLAALEKAPQGRLSLLPSGEASFERLEQRTVRGTTQTRTVTLVALQGLDFKPLLIWVDSEGFFADTANLGWLSVVREGFEGAVPELKAADQAAITAYFERLAKTLTHPSTAPIAIRHAALFDPLAEKTLPGMTVVIDDGVIRAVAPDAAAVIPDGAEIVDATGKTVLPGLWDMHVHLWPTDGLLHIAAGVTSVRDLGNAIDVLRDVKASYESGRTIGPRVHRAGFIDSPGPAAGPTGVLVDNEKDAVAAVDRYADLGYEQIKIYSSVKPELVPPMIAEAHKRGLRVSGHIPGFMTAEQCVRLGFDEIQHTSYLFLNFFSKQLPNPTSRDRAMFVGEHAAELDLDSRPVQEFFTLLHDRRAVVDPTLNVLENWYASTPGTPSPTFAAVADRLPPQVRRGLLGGGLAPPGKEVVYRQGFSAVQRLVRALYTHGVQIVVGTDNGPTGFALHRELELDVEAGIPAPVVLRMATLDAARIMKSDDRLGSIAPGKIADLVLVDGDPTQRIADVRNVRMVWKGGVRFAPAEIDRALGIKP